MSKKTKKLLTLYIYDYNGFVTKDKKQKDL